MVVAFLTIVSAGIFAAHILDALLGGAPAPPCIPHARLPDLQRPYGLLARLKAPVEFDAIDEHAVDVVFVCCCRRLPVADRSSRWRW